MHQVVECTQCAGANTDAGVWATLHTTAVSPDAVKGVEIHRSGLRPKKI